jgi:hypothetical protein
MTKNDTPNLGSHRAPTSVWDKRGWRGPTIEEQVGPWLVSLAGAGFSNPHHARMALRHRFRRDTYEGLAVFSASLWPSVANVSLP